MMSLQQHVIALLQLELNPDDHVTALNDKVLLKISTFNFENHLGAYLQQIYRLVDQRIPQRANHLSLVIQDTGRKYESAFKIWRSV